MADNEKVITNKYENEKGVFINVHTDKREKDHIDFYDKSPADPSHKSVHIDWDSNTGKGKIIDTTNGEKESTDVSCLLTNACIAYKLDSFKDDCYELTTLRWFRDNFLTEEDIQYYYHISPEIVAVIIKLPNNHEIFKMIYLNMILPSINAIEKHDFITAYNTYKTHMHALEKKFINQEQHQKLIRTSQENLYQSTV